MIERLLRDILRPDALPLRHLLERRDRRRFEALDEHARACGLTVTAYIRQAVLGVTPVARRPIAHSAVVAVNRVGTNLNQLVHLANPSGGPGEK